MGQYVKYIMFKEMLAKPHLAEWVNGLIDVSNFKDQDNVLQRRQRDYRINGLEEGLVFMYGDKKNQLFSKDVVWTEKIQ